MLSARLAALLAVAGALAPAAAPPRPLAQSPQLWATIDVCNAHDQPDTIGIRGSMPGDGRAHDAMLMRFRVQYLEATARKWVDLPKGADSGFVAVGSAATARQAGRSFQLAQSATQQAFTLRGVVSFEWEHSGRVVYTLSRTTAAGHKSLAGADPAGYSAATCTIA